MFEAKRFIKENFQSTAGVIAHFRSAGIEPPTDKQAEKWLTRNSIPGEWLAKMIAILEAERGVPVSISDYMGADASVGQETDKGPTS